MNVRPTRGILQGLVAITLATAVGLAALGCRKAAPTAPPPIPEVIITNVVQRDVPMYSEWVGTTEGFVNAQIYPKVPGYLLKQNYKDGDTVHTSQLLFQIDPREYRAALDLAVANLDQQRATFQRNQQDLVRYSALYKSRVISKQDLDHITEATRETKAAVEAAQAAVETAKLNLAWTQVTSLIDGIAGIAKAQVGDLVSTTTLLTTVSQLDPIKVTFPISEREYLHFADRIMQAETNGPSKDAPPLEMILADGSTYKDPGHFFAANRQVNVQTGTIQIQGAFPNPGNTLRPGLYAKVRVAADVLHNALLIPQAAVLSTQGQNQVAVVGLDNTVSLRTVAIGKQFGHLQIVEQGLKPGERVITEGLQKVSDGMQVRPVIAPAAPAPVAAVTPGSQS